MHARVVHVQQTVRYHHELNRVRKDLIIEEIWPMQATLLTRTLMRRKKF